MLFLPARRSILNPLVRDPDARDYIRRVEAADGQALPNSVRRLFDEFVRGCKADGTWPALKACVPMIGASTLAGALVPLTGPAPTNFNFVSGDYDRKTGLLGNGTTKYLDSGRNSNSDPNDNIHQAVYISTAHASGVGAYIGVGGPVAGATILASNRTANEFFARNRNSISNAISGVSASTGFAGASRSSSSSYSLRVSGSSTSFAATAEASINANHWVFARNSPGFEAYTTGRLAFYSIGESLDLALLDSRVTTLVNAIAAAIP